MNGLIDRFLALQREVRDLKTAGNRAIPNSAYFTATARKTITIGGGGGFGQVVEVTVTFPEGLDDIPAAQCGFNLAYLFSPLIFTAVENRQITFTYDTTVTNVTLELEVTVLATQPIMSIGVNQV